MPFFLLKALAFIPGGGLLKNVSLKAILILVALGAIGFGIWKWKDSIKAAVYDQVYRQQVEDQLNAAERELDLARRLAAQREADLQRALDEKQALVDRLSQSREELREGDYAPGVVPEVILRGLEIIREQNGTNF